MAGKKEALGKFLREVGNWSWEEFARAEHDSQYTSNEAIIFALVRACAMQNLSAIKVAVNRIDGKLKTPVDIQYPKIYYLFPNVKKLDAGKPILQLEGGEFEKVVIDTRVEVVEPEVEPAHDLATMGFRETLSMMSDYPRQLPEQIVALALLTEQWVKKNGSEPPEVPKVKSVVAAHLLIMAQNRNMEAIVEVFDSIDGKLVETIQILGEDIYITDYSTTAPPGAEPNKDGVLMIEATIAQNLWAQKLGREQVGDF